MKNSVLTKNQKIELQKDIIWEGKPHQMRVTLRYDDKCGNGHNTFSITGEIWKRFTARDCEYCGCIHNEIEKYFPELKHLIKWHLMGNDEPMHYIANTKYWMEKDNLENAKNTAIWGATELDRNPHSLSDEAFLNRRLPFLIRAFIKDIEKLGFTY